MILVARAAEQRHICVRLSMCRQLSSPGAFQASHPAAPKPALCTSPRAITSGYSAGLSLVVLGSGSPGSAGTPQVMPSRWSVQMAWLVATGGEASCSPPALTSLGEVAPGAASPGPVCPLALQPV